MERQRTEWLAPDHNLSAPWPMRNIRFHPSSVALPTDPLRINKLLRYCRGTGDAASSATDIIDFEINLPPRISYIPKNPTDA